MDDGRIDDECFHVTRVENRASIQRIGLDWRKMGATPGIAGSPRPEMDAVFLCERFSVDFFCRFSQTPVDVWAVDVTGLVVEDGPDGWWIVRSPIERSRLRLLEADRPGTPLPDEWSTGDDGDSSGITGWRAQGE